jgi:hypothetical protein
MTQDNTSGATPEPARTPTTVCALCKTPSILKSSHIIPNAYFKQMKDKTGKLVSFDMEEDTPVVTAQDSWQEYLLCEKCEGKLSTLETKWIRNLRKADVLFAKGHRVVELPDFDYDSFRTFLLSILWRASVTSHEKFADIMLTAHDQEELRLAILAGSTTALGDWAVHIHKIVDRRGLLNFDQMMRQPEMVQALGAVFYRFIFGGYMFDFLLHKQSRGATLLSDGATFPLQSINMTEIAEVMLTGRKAVDKSKRGLDRRRNKR